VENLLSNSVKYTNPGGNIVLSAQRQGEFAVIRVRDNGMGIEPDMLPKVFEMFMQSSRSLDRAQGGIGIGLTLVQRLVELHGGTVKVQSDGAGRGSVFSVRLPVAMADERSSGGLITSAPARPRRVLLVDDNVSAARMLSLLLNKLGDHQTMVVHDGLSALERIRTWRPEVVLLDIGLPGMDGYEVARSVREDGNLGSIRLVAITGYGQDEDRKKSRAAGFDKHLVKPIDAAELERLFTEWDKLLALKGIDDRR
jgi:CheY-like chemotaxis protein